jgi:hypothetical protein
MAVTVRVRDEATSGKETNELSLEFLTEVVTARELIRGRVYQEVTEYNASLSGPFRGLVQPTDAERTLNGFRMPARRRIDWQQQYERALKAFESNGFVLLVGDRQIERLDEEVELRPGTEVTFLKLVPLVGG